MHKLNVINGKISLDDKQLHGVSDFVIKSSTNEMESLVELELKMIVTLDQIDAQSER
jgi:hypothetical protein